MRKLSLCLVIAAASLGLNMANADDVVDTGMVTDVPELVVDPAPVDESAGEPVEEIVDDVVIDDGEVIEGEVIDGEVIDGDIVKEDPGVVDDVPVDEEGTIEDPNVIYYMTGSGDGGTRGDVNCEFCRNLTGEGEEAAAPAADALTPEVMSDAGESNGLGVDALEPMEGDASKRSKH